MMMTNNSVELNVKVLVNISFLTHFEVLNNN